MISDYFDNTNLGSLTYLMEPIVAKEVTGFDNGISTASTYADDALVSANQFLSQLGSFATDMTSLPEITVEIGEINKVITPILLPDAPEKPTGIDYQIPALPIAPVLGEVAPLTLSDAPEFSASKPVLTYPALPSSLSVSVPASPDIIDITIPESPDIIIPVEPALRGVIIPAAPTLNVPVFNYSAPVVPETPSVGEFSFAEPEYVSSLVDTLKAKLLEWVSGVATGIAPSVEAALFNRARSREDVVALREAAEIRRNHASSGFPTPAGSMQAALKEAARQASDKVSAINRDITVKIAEMEQANRHFAMERGIQFEEILIRRANEIASRALEVAKVSFTSALDLYRVIVTRYQAELEAFKVHAAIFETELRAELAQLDIYRSQLEGAKLTGEINMQEVEIYRARVAGVTALIEQYKAQLSGAEITSKINTNIIGRFSEEIRAYGAQVDAKAKEYDAYATQVQAEAKKVDVFTAEANAYRSQIGGYESLVNARAAEKELEFKIVQQNPLEVYRAQVSAFGELVRAESSRVSSLSDVYRSDVQRYATEVGASVQVTQTDIEEYRTKGALLMEEARTQVEALKGNVQRLLSIETLMTEVTKAGGSISAQLAASAMSMLNFSHSVSQSESFAQSNSFAQSMSNSASHSTSNSASESRSYNYNYTS